MFNKSTICKTANKLRKQGYTLSQAFRMAWRLAKGTASVKVAGVSKGTRQTAIQHLTGYAPESVRISLIREKQNTFDSNAIAVFVSVIRLTRTMARIACGCTPADIKASLKAITGGYYADMMCGLRLSLSI